MYRICKGIDEGNCYGRGLRVYGLEFRKPGTKNLCIKGADYFTRGGYTTGNFNCLKER